MQAPPFDMVGAQCTDNASEYESYNGIRCADQRTKGIVILILVFYVLTTNLVRSLIREFNWIILASTYLYFAFFSLADLQSNNRRFQYNL